MINIDQEKTMLCCPCGSDISALHQEEGLLMWIAGHLTQHVPEHSRAFFKKAWEGSITEAKTARTFRLALEAGTTEVTIVPVGAEHLILYEDGELAVGPPLVPAPPTDKSDQEP